MCRHASVTARHGHWPGSVEPPPITGRHRTATASTECREGASRFTATSTSLRHTRRITPVLELRCPSSPCPSADHGRSGNRPADDTLVGPRLRTPDSRTGRRRAHHLRATPTASVSAQDEGVVHARPRHVEPSHAPQRGVRARCRPTPVEGGRGQPGEHVAGSLETGVGLGVPEVPRSVGCAAARDQASVSPSSTASRFTSDRHGNAARPCRRRRSRPTRFATPQRCGYSWPGSTSPSSPFGWGMNMNRLPLPASTVLRQ